MVVVSKGEAFDGDVVLLKPESERPMPSHLTNFRIMVSLFAV